MTDKPFITIRYCTGCNWLLRAGWLGQEILSSLHDVVAQVSLIPDDSGGLFEVHVGDVLIWERVRDGGFPDAAELKRRVRNIVDPEREMGHVDNPSGKR